MKSPCSALAFQGRAILHPIDAFREAQHVSCPFRMVMLAVVSSKRLMNLVTDCTLALASFCDDNAIGLRLMVRRPFPIRYST